MSLGLFYDLAVTNRGRAYARYQAVLQDPWVPLWRVTEAKEAYEAARAKCDRLRMERYGR